MAKKNKGFWGLFDEAFEHLDKAMDALPKHIDEEIEAGNNSVNTVGHNNVVINGSSIVKQRTVFGHSTSTINQGGKRIVITTKNGKTTIKVNGTEYVPKENK